MKFVILTDHIFKLNDLEYCSHSEECTYFDFGRKFFLYDDKVKNIYDNFVIFLKDGQEVFDVKRIVDLQEKKVSFCKDDT